MTACLSEEKVKGGMAIAEPYQSADMTSEWPCMCAEKIHRLFVVKESPTNFPESQIIWINTDNTFGG